MRSNLIDNSISKLASLQQTVSKSADDIAKNITEQIQQNVPLIVGSRITVAGNEIILSGTRIPVEDYHPQLLKFSKTRGSVQADFSMWNKEKTLNKVFFNPKADKIFKRQGKGAYPIQKVYGPSVAQLYMQKHQSFVEENTKILLNNVKNLGL